MQLENYFLGRKLIRSRPALFPFASYVFRFSFEFENAVVPVPTPPMHVRTCKPWF